MSLCVCVCVCVCVCFCVCLFNGNNLFLLNVWVSYNIQYIKVIFWAILVERNPDIKKTLKMGQIRPEDNTRTNNLYDVTGTPPLWFLGLFERP